MDGIFATEERHCGCPHRIGWGTAGNNVRQRRLFLLDHCRGAPRRADVLATDHCGALPLHAGSAYADRIAQRAAVTHDIVELALVCPDDDRARTVATIER